MVSNLDWQTISSKFKFHWVLYILCHNKANLRRLLYILTYTTFWDPNLSINLEDHAIYTEIHARPSLYLMYGMTP